MESIVDETTTKNSNNSQYVNKMHENNLYTIDVICSSNNNNNNNEKMDDANKTKKITNSMQQDSISSDSSPINNSNNVDNIDQLVEDSFHINDNNQSNSSEDASDNNSTDNISYVSDDLVENVIILPNNFLSEDEQSTNSDDCVYAYRGADGFEPVEIEPNADDETDYLEMDFEPDPASEIEHEANEISTNNDTRESRINFRRDSITNSFVNVLNNGLNDVSHSEDMLDESRTRQRNDGWVLPNQHSHLSSVQNNQHNSFEHIIQSNNDELRNCSFRFSIDNNNKSNIASKSNESGQCINNSIESKNEVVLSETNEDEHISYYDKTVSLSTKKYTGTIPKINRHHNRVSRTKPSTLMVNGNSMSSATCESQQHTNSKESADQNGDYRLTMKRCKNEIKNTSFTYCDQNNKAKASNDDVQAIPLGSRSMSYPCETFLNQRNKQNEDLPNGYVNDKSIELASSSGNQKYNSCLDIIDSCDPINEAFSNDNSPSITFYSNNCTIETIVNVLVR